MQGEHPQTPKVGFPPLKAPFSKQAPVYDDRPKDEETVPCPEPCPKGWGRTSNSRRMQDEAQSKEKGVMKHKPKGRLPSQHQESRLADVMPAEQRS